MAEKRDWVVWSVEHNAWWGPNRGGYFTHLVGGAGLYTEAEAREIERSANGPAGRGRISERAEPLSKHAEYVELYAARVRELQEALGLQPITYERRGHYYGRPLSMRLEGGRLAVEIGAAVLAHAAAYSDWANPYDAEAHDYIRTFAITNAEQLAADVVRAALREREDGSTPLSDFLDAMIQAALDDGSEAVECDQRIAHGETSPLEASWVNCLTPTTTP